ncbi:hypothetical protein ERO13_A11G012500v2 [Gossypium hirsutum]|uniref:Protein WAVE n=1 Tax=Gossypium hirsutum TaxID=3635 RepID=A0A1U8L729_GOSHI|nr:uncharacterized protein LOC107923250 [Gossypium hirsutum]KAG4172687.1 hypothetical protein ERO13_A11G012500v2 [Gossypium hirsutum]KAG4172688.1 hypothetical protein ERO13_A11G012500v2 [Gossypium hirsutum]
MKMRSENEDQCLVLRSKSEDTTRDFHKKSKRSYSREFLFSFAKLDTCKKLPTGFDSSILRELDDQSTSVLHSYHDSDASRFQSSLSHCSRRNPEQGILGSGARVHRDIAETIIPVVQGSGFHLLNRSSEPYRPPHLCKAKYYSERESKDHYNDETFGSPDNLSQDRAEEEKIRRDSFELMRKEQEMVTQEKQKFICDDYTENLKPYIAIVLEDSEGDFESKGSESRDVKEGHSENPLVCSSDLTHLLAEGEKMTAVDQKAIEHDSTKSSFGANGSGDNLMKSVPVPVTKRTSMELYGPCNPGVISCESLEEPILSEINGHCSTQRSNCSNYDEESQNILSLLRKEAGLTDLVESSKLKNTWSLDKSYVSETEIDNYQLNKFKKNLHGPISRSTGTKKDLTSRFKWDDSVKSRPIGNVESIEFSSFLVQTSASKRSSDVQDALESKNSSLCSYDELEICLPDEDSLITVDDYILPQESLFVAAGENRFDLTRFESSAFVHRSHDLTSSETYFNNPYMQQSNPQLRHSQLKSTKERVSCSEYETSPKSSIIKPRDLKSYAYTLQALQHFPTNVHHTPSQYFRAAETGFDYCMGYHLPPQQMYGLPRAAFPQHTSDQMACYEHDQNATFNSSLNFNRQFYNSLQNASSRPSEIVIESEADGSSYFGWPSVESVWKTN